MMDWEQHFRGMKKPRVEFGADEFGAVARGIIPAGVTGAAVIPPGRYWLDAFGDKIQRFQAWAAGKPEVKIETSQEDTESSPAHLFVIFTVPKTANNFGIPGVLFPTVDLGFPTIADATVQTSDDTVRRPPSPTVQSVLQDAATVAGSTTQSFLGQISAGTMIKAGLAGLVGLLLLRKFI